MKEIYEEIKVQRVSDAIVRQIEKLILEGKLNPGEKLPPEREFAEFLGVGRSSLREAINTLETLGFLEIKKRKGAFVRGLSSSISMDPLKRIFHENTGTLLQLYEIRNDIELASAYWAAKRRTEQDLIRIGDCLKKMKENSQLHRLRWNEDRSFHIAIAQATHNFLRIHILQDLFDLTGEYVEEVFVRVMEDPNYHLIVMGHHEAIFKAIEGKDADSARSLMYNHFIWTNDKIGEYF